MSRTTADIEADMRQRDTARMVAAYGVEGAARLNAHWDSVRASFAAGTYVEPHPPRPLKEQAAKRIRELERDLAEWRAIEAST